MATFRRLLFRCGVDTTANANIIPQDGTDLLRRDNINELSDEDEEDQGVEMNALTLYAEDTVQYVAGFIARKLQLKLKCMTCALALTSDCPFPNDASLLSIKDRGGLLLPSISIERICKISEQVFRSKDKWQGDFIATVLRNIQGLEIFPNLNEHHIDTLNGIDSHVTSLIRLIIHQYFNIRQHKLCKLTNIENHQKLMRRSFTNILHLQLHQ